MKRLFTTLLLGLLYVAALFAQSGNAYFNIGAVSTKMTQPDFPELKSNYGLNLNVGQIFPIIGQSSCIGLDVTWFDFAYTNYKVKHITSESTDQFQYAQYDLAVQIGPCLSIVVGDWMRLHGYFRYAPTYSILAKPEDKFGNYATAFVTGGSLTFGAIGLGAEYRFGGCYYKRFGNHTAEFKTEFTGFRAYLAFRF